MEFKGELYINTKDAWTEWRAKLIDDSVNNLLLPANPKPYVENSNRNEDGTRVYIYNPRLQERTIELTFGLTFFDKDTYLQKYHNLVSYLQSESLITLLYKPLNKSYKLLLTDFVSVTDINFSCKLVVRFRELNPSDRDELVFKKVLGTTDNKILSTIANQAITV